MGHWNHIVNRRRLAILPTTVPYEYIPSSTIISGAMVGWSVDITPDGVWSIVGAYQGNIVHIYKTDSTGIPIVFQTITPTWTGSVMFGYDVAISDDGLSCIISDPRSNSFKGSIRIYTRANTSSAFTLSFTYISTMSGTGQLGISVDMSGDGLIAVAGSLDSTRATSSGSVSSFVNTGGVWSYGSRTFIPTNEANANFGYSVALSSKTNIIHNGDYVLAVGAPIAVSNGSAGIGRTFIGKVNQWGGISLPTKNSLDGALASESHGYKVDMIDNAEWLAINSGNSGYNLVKLYRYNSTAGQYVYVHNIVMTGAGVSESSFSPDGTWLAIGRAVDAITNAKGAVSMYRFNVSTNVWDYQYSIGASDGAISDQFGVAVGLSSNGSNMIVGAHYGDLLGVVNTGKVYYYNLDGQ